VEASPPPPIDLKIDNSHYPPVYYQTWPSSWQVYLPEEREDGSMPLCQGLSLEEWKKYPILQQFLDSYQQRKLSNFSFFVDLKLKI